MSWVSTLMTNLMPRAEDLFEADADGSRVYVPAGVANVFARHGYRVPDEATELVIRRAHARSELGMLVAIVVTLAVFGAIVAFRPPGFEGFVVFYAFVIALAALLLLNLAASWVLVRRLGLVRSPHSRSAARAAAYYTRQLGPRWILWLVAAAGTLMIVVAIWVGKGAFERGDSELATFITFLAVPSIAAVPILVMGLRTRRLEEQNARLESLVATRTEELRELNRTLEERVKEQVQHIERLGQLKHFFAAPVAEMILNEKGFDPARVHRRELTAVSVDLRGFTAFSETSEPEEVISVLRTYHAELGIQVNRCQATLEHFAGDGVMLFLNDPVEVEDHPMRAVELAIGLRAAMRPHLEEWRSHGFDIGLGIGVATGYATIGAVGYEGRWEYAAIGTVCNLAARLCAEAKDGQIVVSKRFVSRLGERAQFESLGERTLKGLSRPVAAFNVLGLKAPSPIAA